MNSLLFSLSFFMLIYTINSQYRFYCYENYCTTTGNECPEFSCKNGRTINNATKCGCCPLCIKTLKRDAECKTRYLSWEQNIAECGPGLVCKASKPSSSKGKCEPSDCLKKKENYEKERKSMKEKLHPSFDCDHFGNFEPTDGNSSKPHIVCIDDVLCFCVDYKGKRIFGTDVGGNSSISNMKCDCSRDISNFTKTVNFEKFPRCLPNGDYDPLQCTQNRCFCMDTLHPSDELMDAEDMEKLLCYNDNRRPERNPLTKCLKQRREEIEYLNNRNSIVIGADLTRCEYDGTYYPLQCKKGQCSCVKRNGDTHIGYEDIKKEEGDLDLMCRCMRDKEIIQSYGGKKTANMKIFIEDLKCTGNYTSDYSILSKSFINDFIKQ